MHTVTVIIPPPLRKYIAGESQVQVEAALMTDLFEGLFAAHPGLEGRLLDDDGSVRRHLNVFVGGEDIRWQKGLDTPLSDGDQVTILTALAGG